MPAFLDGGSSAFSTTLTTLNTSGFDRFLLVHTAASSSASIQVYIDAGTTTRVLANYVTVFANDIRDFGPFFMDDSQALRANTDVALGHFKIDEERP